MFSGATVAVFKGIIEAYVARDADRSLMGLACRSAVLGLLVATLLPAAARSQESDPYVGRFRHANFDFELERVLKGYHGWLIIDGRRHEVSADVDRDELRGFFFIDGQRFDFTAKAEDDDLILYLPVVRSLTEARRSMGQWRKQRYRAKRIEPERTPLAKHSSLVETPVIRSKQPSGTT